ncbi:transposase [Pseudomonas taiwanensis SJ9]|uniref:Transposase n=1 Tax=Pseudomonas taiwanensis SJ9 TaxID=1388762 RepID=V7D7M0_9PSED|nr:transposase [Pseudomonas taiwanensis SJ9]
MGLIMRLGGVYETRGDSKRQFGYVKTRFRGLAKNTAQLVTLFALSNLWMARRHLLTNAGEVRL